MFLCKKAGKRKKKQQNCAFSENKTLHQHSGANFKKTFFAKFSIIFLAFSSFFQLFSRKMKISTSVWDEQHPNAGQNIQQRGPRNKKTNNACDEKMLNYLNYKGFYYYFYLTNVKECEKVELLIEFSVHQLTNFVKCTLI